MSGEKEWAVAAAASRLAARRDSHQPIGWHKINGEKL